MRAGLSSLQRCFPVLRDVRTMLRHTTATRCSAQSRGQLSQGHTHPACSRSAGEADAFKIQNLPDGRCRFALPRSSHVSTRRMYATAPAAGGNKEQLIDPEVGSLYDHPDLYDCAFSYRDFVEEAGFLKDLFKTNTGGQELTSVLDFGCGTGRHILELAAAGVACRGVDLNQQMLDFAADLAKQKGVPLRLEQGDMRSYVLAEGEKPVDMALIMMGTLQHMLSNDDAIKAVGGAKDAVRSGGLIVLECAHPYDLWDGTLVTNSEEYLEVWDGDTADGGKLYVQWGTEGDPFDALTQVLERTVTVTKTKEGKPVRTLMDVCEMRQFSMQELYLLARMLDLEVSSGFDRYPFP
mmetsp:Transcript_16341/g.45547  ORF Transcript_16341/g.45547 Transcript_16341/m.45547 type:complete len:351 (-) Transcript_16341:209-1261(-)